MVRFNYELWTMHYALMEASALMYLLFFCLKNLMQWDENSPLENYKVIFRRNNGANESNISSLLDYCRVQPIEDIVSTPKGGGG